MLLGVWRVLDALCEISRAAPTWPPTTRVCGCVCVCVCAECTESMQNGHTCVFNIIVRAIGWYPRLRGVGGSILAPSNHPAMVQQTGRVPNRCLGIARPPSAFCLFLKSQKGLLRGRGNTRIRGKTAVWGMSNLKLKFASLSDDARAVYVEEASDLKTKSAEMRRLKLSVNNASAAKALIEAPADVAPVLAGSSVDGCGSVCVAWVALECSMLSPGLPASVHAELPLPTEAPAKPTAGVVYTDAASGLQQTLTIDASAPLGHGTYGQCFVAKDHVRNRSMCVKMVQAGAMAEAARLSLRKELAAMGRMHHPNVLTSWSLVFGSDGSLAGLLLPLEAGNFRMWLESVPEDVSASVLAERLVGPDERSCLVQIADGIAHMHGRRIVHLDLKPENVLMSRTQKLVPLLADFGRCKSLVEADGIPDEDVRASGINTETYRPIELCGAADMVITPRPRHDIWAFGCIVFETVARSNPAWRSKSEKLLRLFSGINMSEPATTLYRSRNYRLTVYIAPAVVSAVCTCQPVSCKRGQQTSALTVSNMLAALPVREQ